ncbi:MAG: magnesium chelatase subunit ChlI family protein [Planctomycetota bacterium]
MDIHIEVPPVQFRKLRSTSNGSGSKELRQQVQSARTRQRQRFGLSTTTNATMSHKQVEKHCTLDEQSEMMLKQAIVEFHLSARAHDKICKVARTIADLNTSPKPSATANWTENFELGTRASRPPDGWHGQAVLGRGLKIENNYRFRTNFPRSNCPSPSVAVRSCTNRCPSCQ